MVKSPTRWIMVVWQDGTETRFSSSDKALHPPAQYADAMCKFIGHSRHRPALHSASPARTMSPNCSSRWLLPFSAGYCMVCAAALVFLSCGVGGASISNG